jgi:hypothetical protein
MRSELINTQADVERAMMELRDEKMAHLISLGGWLRGLEISATAVVNDFSPQRARILAQPDLAAYFTEELKTLPPNVIHTPLFDQIRAGVDAINAELRKTSSSALAPADVATIETQTRAINDAIRKAE